MKIGKIKRRITVEPIRSPIPQKEPRRQVETPRPEPVPVKVRP